MHEINANLVGERNWQLNGKSKNRKSWSLEIGKFGKFGKLDKLVGN